MARLTALFAVVLFVALAALLLVVEAAERTSTWCPVHLLPPVEPEEK